MEKKINVEEVLSTLDNSIERLEEGLKPELLSNAEQLRVDAALNDVIRLGLKVKLQYQQRKIENIIKSLDENKEIDLVKIQLMNNELDKILKI